MKAIKIVYQIPKKSRKDKSCLRMKQARLFLEHCEENDIKCGWKLLRRWSGQDISTRAAKLWYTMQREGKLNATIESIEEQCNTSFQRRAQKKKKQRKIREETKLLRGTQYTGNADRTIRRKIADLESSIKNLPVDSILKLLQGKEVVAHLGQNLVADANFGTLVLTRGKNSSQDILCRGRATKFDQKLREFS